MTGRLLLAGAWTVGAPAGVLAWLWMTEQVEKLVPVRRRRVVRAWLWLLPAVALVGTYLLWPLIHTAWLSLRDADGERFVGMANFGWLVDSREVREALQNNVLWVVLLVGGCVLLGLLVAVLADRVRWEAFAKSVIVAPVAISFVSGAVIWGFVYDYQAPGLPQVGTLNAVWADVLGREPVAWLVDRSTNNSALIAIGLWSTLGFATVILSAALKGLPAELTDAGRIDGANAWQIFRHIVLPQLRPTILVVATLVGVMALKAFDIVYVLTAGNYGTDVIANVLYRQLFVDQHAGRASAVALLIAVLAVPLFVLNARSARREGAS